MHTRTFTCFCTNVIGLSDNQADIKCAKCGRVYSYNGQFMWRESPGNDVPGSSDILPEPMIKPGEERRAPDQDKAVEKAFVSGDLPEEDRRTEIVDPPPVVPPAPPVKEASGGKSKK